MRIVLDTNVLVSALITKGTPPDLLYQAWDAGSFELVTSEVQLLELERVLMYEKLQPFIQREEAEVLLDAMSAVAQVVDVLPKIDLSRDPDDNAILATAVAGGADLVVTGDRSHLLELETVHDIPIVTPRQALQRMGKEARR